MIETGKSWPDEPTLILISYIEDGSFHCVQTLKSSLKYTTFFSKAAAYSIDTALIDIYQIYTLCTK